MSKLTDKILLAVPHDKLMHFVVGAIIFALSSYFIGYYGVLVVAYLALFQELYGDRFDLRDLLITVAGAVLMALYRGTI